MKRYRILTDGKDAGSASTFPRALSIYQATTAGERVELCDGYRRMSVRSTGSNNERRAR